MNYSIKIKSVYKIVLILIPIIIVGLFIYPILTARGENYLLFLIMILLTSFFSYIGYYKSPVEIQLYDSAINFKSIYGFNNFVNIKDIISFVIALIIKSDKEKLLCLASFMKISQVVGDIKKQNIILN